MNDLEARLAAIETDVEAAKQEVFALCRGRHNGGREWTMTIPVYESDSDLVLIKGLTANDRLLAALRRAVEGLEAAARSDLDSVGAKRVLADLARLLGEGEK